MYHNVYVGTGFSSFLNALAMDPTTAPFVAAGLLEALKATDPEARMKAIADEITAQNPAIVGLGEVEKVLSGPFDLTAPSTVVEFDFLKTLMDALDANGCDYRIVSQVENSDVETPVTADGVTFTDIRLIDRDVVLVRNDVKVIGNVEEVLLTPFVTTLGAATLERPRHFQKLLAKLPDGTTFTFFNTHLESRFDEVGFSNGNQDAQTVQTAELIEAISSVEGRVVLVGDINSDGNVGEDNYNAFINSGLVDAFPMMSAPTCCQDSALLNEESRLFERVDVIMSKGFRSIKSDTVLDDPSERIALENGSTVWPSDHAAVVATLAYVK